MGLLRTQGRSFLTDTTALFSDIFLSGSSTAGFFLLVGGMAVVILNDIVKDAVKNAVKSYIAPYIVEFIVLMFAVFAAYFLQKDGHEILAFIQLLAGITVVLWRFIKQPVLPGLFKPVLLGSILLIPMLAGIAIDGLSREVGVGDFIVSHSFRRNSGTVDTDNRLHILSQEFRDAIDVVFDSVLEVYPKSISNYRANLYPKDTAGRSQTPRIRLSNVVRGTPPHMHLIVKPIFAGAVIDPGDWVFADGPDSDATVLYLKSALGIIGKARDHGKLKFNQADELKVRKTILDSFYAFRREAQAEVQELEAIQAVAQATSLTDEIVMNLLDGYLNPLLAGSRGSERSSGLAQVNNHMSLE